MIEYIISKQIGFVKAVFFWILLGLEKIYEFVMSDSFFKSAVMVGIFLIVNYLSYIYSELRYLNKEKREIEMRDMRHLMHMISEKLESEKEAP